MKSKDDEIWSLQKQELMNGTDLDRHFLKVVEFWCEAAEKWLDDNRASLPFEHSGIRQTFYLVEKEFGAISTHWLSQLLTVISLYWYAGEDLLNSFTVFERRLVEEGLGKKLHELQEQAEQIS